MNWLTIVQLVMQYGSTVESIFHTAMSNESILQKAEELAAPIGGLIKTLGAQIFPSATPELQIVGGIIAGFSPDYTKWLQAAMNNILGTNLDVDGIYGPKTKAAVQQVQTKLGIEVDGIAGKVTQAAIQAFLTKK